MVLLISASRFEPEDRAGAGIRVHQGDVVGAQGEVAVGLIEVFDPAGEEHEVRRRRRPFRPVRLRRQNLVEWWTPGSRVLLFSKLYRLASDCERIRS